jgi:shikimate dehydrogenase
VSERGPHAGRLRGSTHVVGVIGWPVSHSLSPAIHNAAFRAMDMDWVYVPLPVPPGRVRAAIEGLRSLGLVGANVTMPHKTDVADAVDERSDDAARLRAVNTVVVGAAGIAGHNTDASGFDRFLRRDAGFDPSGRTALIYGAGGAARACALALARGGLGSLVVVLRDTTRVAPLADALEGLATDVRAVSFDDAEAIEAELVVNATPLGGRGESLPMPAVAAGGLVVDLLYRPSLTPFLERARALGANAFGGLGLLLHQAALSFELWTGQVPDLDVMSAAALAELADAGHAPEPPA